MSETPKPTPEEMGTSPDNQPGKNRDNGYNPYEGSYPPYPKNPDKQMSATAYFHLAGDANYGIDSLTGEENPIIDPHDPLMREEIERQGRTPEKLRRIISILKEIENIKLANPDRNSAQELSRRQKTARDLVRQVFDQAEDYLGYVESFSRKKKSYREQYSASDFIKEFTALDKGREIKHNALVDATNIACRYITQQFGELTPAALEKFEDAEEAAGRKILNVERIKLPPKVLFTEEVEPHDRKSVALWAMDLAHQARDFGIDTLLPQKKNG